MKTVGLLMSCFVGVVANAADWPCWRGTDGSGASSSGVRLVDHLSKASLIWESEEKDIPSSYNRIMGGAAGPVLADGRVYLNYCTPSGTAVAENYYAQLLGGRTPEQAVKNNGKSLGIFIRKPEDIRRRCLIRADDVILCLDAATGKTVWKAQFAETGVNVSMQVRGWPFAKNGPHGLAAVAYGKVVGIGSLGKVHCVNATDGKLAWTYDLGCLAGNLKKVAGAVTAKSIPQFSDPRTSPTFAGGVFVIPDGSKLVGLDPEKGTKLWETPYNSAGPCAPIRWVSGGKEYIIAANACLDPATGKVLWTAAGAVHSDGTVAVGEGHLVCSGKDADKTGAGGVGLNAFKITPQGAEKAWATDATNAGVNNCSPVIMAGHVYVKAAADRTTCHYLCVNLATGTVTATANYRNDSCGSMVGADGRIFYNGTWIDADPKNFKVLHPGLVGKEVSVDHQMGGDASYALAASTTPCIVDGRLYVRGQHSVLCYDLKAK